MRSAAHWSAKQSSRLTDRLLKVGPSVCSTPETNNNDNNSNNSIKSSPVTLARHPVRVGRLSSDDHTLLIEHSSQINKVLQESNMQATSDSCRGRVVKLN